MTSVQLVDMVTVPCDISDNDCSAYLALLHEHRAVALVFR